MKVHRATWHLLLGALALPAAVSAQGFGLNEIGSCAIARGFATTSGGCRDASLVYWNPAAITTLKGNNGIIGVSPIAVFGDFTQDTTGRLFNADAPVEFPPHLFWSRATETSALAYGIGAYVPYGLTSQWDALDFPGRFQATRASIQTIYVQPTVAYQLNDRWSIGGGPIIAHSSVELGQATDLSQQEVAPGVTFARLGIARETEFARATVTGDGWGFGFTAGIFGKVSDNWQLGARYLHGIEFEYEGDAKFTQTNTNLVIGGTIPGALPAGTLVDTLVAPNFAEGQALGPQAVRAWIDHPAQVQVGATYTGFRNTELTFEYAWLGWKAFETLRADFENLEDEDDLELIEDYNNSSSFRFGAQHTYRNGWQGRAGITGSTSAAPSETVTALLPEQDRYTLNLGVGIPFAARWTVDAAYAYVGTWGRRGRTTERESRDQTATQLNNGFYRLSANIFSLSLKATY